MPESSAESTAEWSVMVMTESAPEAQPDAEADRSGADTDATITAAIVTRLVDDGRLLDVGHWRWGNYHSRLLLIDNLWLLLINDLRWRLYVLRLSLLRCILLIGDCRLWLLYDRRPHLHLRLSRVAIVSRRRRCILRWRLLRWRRRVLRRRLGIGCSTQ